MPVEVVAQTREEQLEGKGGVRIFVRSWQPAERPRGVVLLVHGFNSHSGYYRWVAEQLTESGLAVYAPDLRGRGRSSGERSYVARFADYVCDVELVANLARSRAPGLPTFVLGHSAGGVVACVYALAHQQELAGLICESFAHQVPAPDLALAALRGLSHLAPHAQVLRLKNEDFSRDAAVVAAMNADPLIANEVQPMGTVAEMVRADARLRRDFREIRLPVLILHGTGDRVTKPSGSRLFFETTGSKDKTLKLYEGHAHDLLNDLGKEEVLREIQVWIEGRLPRV